MSRVYLMADFGNGPRMERHYAEPADLPESFEAIVAGAHRWWLVEAESADAARTIIRVNGTGNIGVPVYETPIHRLGCILDQGGAS